VNCQEDTAPADKTAAAIAAWEKKRGVVKPTSAKKAETKRGPKRPRRLRSTRRDPEALMRRKRREHRLVLGSVRGEKNTYYKAVRSNPAED
jgi:hypothetical protein